MTWGDDWLSNGLPTFDGGKDKSLARSMIDRLGGPGGFKTAYRTNADGSVTMVQLKGSMPPEITTTSATQMVVAPISYEFVGERMRDYESAYPTEAYHLTVDFAAGTVTNAEILLDKYVGSDGSMDWKRYHRGLRWNSADGSTYLDFSFTLRRITASSQAGSIHTYNLFDGINFLPQLDPNSAPSGQAFAKITADVGGTPTVIILNENEAVDASTGAAIGSYLVGKPDGYLSYCLGRDLYSILRSPAGVKTLYGAVRLQVRLDVYDNPVYGIPGTYLFTDGSTSHTVVETLEATGGIDAAYYIGGTVTTIGDLLEPYYPGNQPYYSWKDSQKNSNGTQTMSEFTRIPMGGYFVGETAVPISMIISSSGTGVSESSLNVHSTGTLANGSDQIAIKTENWSGSCVVNSTLSIDIDGAEVYSETFSHGKTQTFSSTYSSQTMVETVLYETRVQSDVDFVSASVLSVPESRVFALVIGKESYPGFDLLHPPTTQDVTFELTFIVVDVDKSRNTSHTITTTSSEPYYAARYVGLNDAPPLGVTSVYGVPDADPWRVEGHWVTSVSEEAPNPIIVTTDYVAPPYIPVSFPSSARITVGLAQDQDSTRPGLAVCGGIYAGDDVILVSARNPRNNDQKLSLAINRTTGEKVVFDHGFGYEFLYSDLKEIP